MNVLLTGGTGLVGGGILAALTQAGHDVTAIVRSDESAAAVQAAGATPVLGDLTDTDWLTEQLSAVDGAIHAASPGDASSAGFDTSVVNAVVAAFGGTTKPYVHTGGAWILGSGTDLTDDGPIAAPALTAWRPEVEAIVLDADVLASVVMPSIVYGHGGGIPNLVLQAPRTGTGAIRLIGDGSQHWGTVHVDDLAALYVAVLSSGQALGRVVGTGPDHLTVREIAEADGSSAEAETPEASRARLGTPLADALMVDQQFADGGKAADLGWVAAAPSLVQEIRSGSYAQHG